MSAINFDDAIAVFSAALQTVKLWFQIRDATKVARRAETAYRRTKNAKLSQVQGDRMKTLVPADVHDALLRRVERCWEAFTSVVQDEAAKQAECDAAVERLTDCLCSELARIERVNKKLPPGKLRDWSRAYCR